MGSIISMGVNTHMAKNQYYVYAATQNAEKTIGTAQIDVDNLVNETNANIQNALKGENNALLAARAALGNYQKSAKSEAILRSAGSKYNAGQTNLARVADNVAGGSLERRIQAAEAQGELTASFAASGTGGGSQQMLKAALAGTMARREVRIKETDRLRRYDAVAQLSGIMPGAVQAIDQGQVFVPVDATKVIPKKVLTPMWQADFMPTRRQYALSATAGQLGAAAGSMWGKSNGSGSSTSSGSRDSGSSYEVSTASDYYSYHSKGRSERGLDNGESDSNWDNYNTGSGLYDD